MYFVCYFGRFNYLRYLLRFAMSADNCTVKDSVEDEYELDEPVIGDEDADPIFTAEQTTICQYKRP